MEIVKKLISAEKVQKTDYILSGILIILSLVLLGLAVTSIGWRIYHDASIMMYIAMLIDKFDRIPYRQIYEMNMPGSLFIYYIIGKITNYSDLGFRVVDLSLLTVIIASTYIWLRNISWKVAWAAPVLFGIIYLWFGPENALQRDYLLVALLSCSIMVAYALPKMNRVFSFFITGILTSVACLIKPHAILSFGIVFLLQIYRQKQREEMTSIFKFIICYVVGFILPILVTILYLWKNQALGGMLDIIKNYFPLYGHLNGELTTMYGVERLKYNFINYFKFRQLSPLIIPAVLSCFIYLRYGSKSQQNKILIYFLILSAIIGSVYPALSGQFFLYHYFIFLYFTIIMSTLFLPFVFDKNIKLTFVSLLTLILAFAWVTNIYHRDVAVYNERMGFVDDVSDFLNKNLRPGETVQPLDWTTGVLNGMMRAETPLATSFSCDFQFYHDVNDPYIQSIRRRFITELEEAKPRYIIWINPEYRVFVYGENTTMDFPELNNLISERYKPVIGNDVFAIVERKV